MPKLYIEDYWSVPTYLTLYEVKNRPSIKKQLAHAATFRTPKHLKRLQSHAPRQFLKWLKSGAALSQAAWLGNTANLHYLLNQGIAFTPTILQQAIRAALGEVSGYDCIPLLLEAGGVIGIQEAALMGDKEKVLSLLAEGVSINGQEEDDPPLCCVVDAPLPPDMFEWLLEHGADINRGDTRGKPPLMYAIKWGRYLMALDLIKRGANVNHVDINGETPLLHAIFYHCEECIPALLERGADVTAPGIVASSAAVGIASLLERALQQGAAIDDTDRMGRTAMEWAQIKQRSDIILILKQFGAKE